MLGFVCVHKDVVTLQRLVEGCKIPLILDLDLTLLQAFTANGLGNVLKGLDEDMCVPS